VLFSFVLEKEVNFCYNVRSNKRNFMKKAVVKIGGKQYVVAEKETLRVDLLPEGTKDLALDALLVIDGDKTTVGEPTVKGVKVKAKVVEAKVAGDKIRVIRYHSKKRVHTETGHRQKYSEIEIVSIA
jgi:large subunit ribosomal protein L21